jgi:hypothetical protein
MIGYVTWESYDVAKREIIVFTARATDAMKDEQFDRAMRYALMAYPPARQHLLAHAFFHRTGRQARRRGAVLAAPSAAQRP